jgi:hypothetical protein
MLFEKFGITDLKSYFEKLLPAIVVRVVLGAAIGAYRDAISGFSWLGLAGIAAPVALIWLAVVISYVAVNLHLCDIPLSRSIMRPSIAVPLPSVSHTAWD